MVGLILVNIIDLRPELDISGEPEDSTILAKSEYKSSLTTVVEKDTTDEAKMYRLDSRKTVLPG